MAKVREIAPKFFEFYCPACGKSHFFWTARQNGEELSWIFNNDLDNPTVKRDISNDTVVTDGQRLCHLNITDGQIHYLPDCGHEMAGQTVDMVDVNE